jgi:hypothetical protein
MVPTQLRARVLEARQAACSVSKEGGSRGTAPDIAVVLLAWASRPQRDGTTEQRKGDGAANVR